MISKELIKQVKRKLNITWDEADTDARVMDIIADGQALMRKKLGIANPDFDFSEPGLANSLFLSWCLYEWNHVAASFDANYMNDILQARSEYEVEQFETAETE